MGEGEEKVSVVELLLQMQKERESWESTFLIPIFIEMCRIMCVLEKRLRVSRRRDR